MMQSQHPLEELDIEEQVYLFHEMVMAVARSNGGRIPAVIDLMAARTRENEYLYLVASRPDGPVIALTTEVGPAADAVPEDAVPWANRQRWTPVWRLRGTLDADGDWYMEELA